MLQFDEETRALFSAKVASSILLHLAEDGGVVSDEWNGIFPDYKFEGAEEFLRRVWENP